jgi:hypothetical protein
MLNARKTPATDKLVFISGLEGHRKSTPIRFPTLRLKVTVTCWNRQAGMQQPKNLGTLQIVSHGFEC